MVQVVMITRDDNLGMQATARKLGCTLEATYREEFFHEGKFRDSLGYSILDREWGASRR